MTRSSKPDRLALRLARKPRALTGRMCSWDILKMQSVPQSCCLRCRWWHRLETTPKLFTLTFVLVAFSAKDATSEPLPLPSEMLLCIGLVKATRRAFEGSA